MIRRGQGDPFLIYSSEGKAALLFLGRECKWLLQNTHMHHPLKVLIKQNIMSLMLHGAPGLLLWCFQPNNKSHRADTAELPQGGFWKNLASCRACSSPKQQSVKITKENCSSLEKMSKSWESVGTGSQGRPELVLFTPAALSSFSVKDWLSCFSVTWCYPLYSHPEVSKMFSAFFLYICMVRPRWSWAKLSLSLKSHKRQGNFAAEVVQFSVTYRVTKKSDTKSITGYTKIINVYVVPYFFPNNLFSVSLC